MLFRSDLPLVEAGGKAEKWLGIMLRRILKFDTDADGDWPAELECGHYQHVRHDPPLRIREWVLTEEGRRERIGQLLDCKKCLDTSNAVRT